MNSRMNKYYDDNNELMNSRVNKNARLYQEIDKNELENFDVKSNAVVLGDNKDEIDIEKIKKILDTKYNEGPKRKSIRLEETEEEQEEKEITKEYDINVILEKAKEQKTDNYEEERLKKLRDTQFDILKNLDIDNEEKSENELESAEEKLKDLINTIAINEKNIKTSLDILSDLKGSDNTEVLEGLKEEVNNNLEDSLENNLAKEINKNIVLEKEEEENKKEEDNKLINSFYTSSNALKEKDFEDIDDFSKSIESNNIWVKVIVILVILILIVGVFLLIKSRYFS